MASEKVHIKLTGLTPLLMHNPRLADPLDFYAKSMKAITSRRSKTDEDLMELMRLEFQGGLHIDEDTGMGPYVPQLSLRGVLVETARVSRKGAAMERGITILDLQGAQLTYSGPRERDTLWEDENFRSVLPAKLRGSATVMRCRPQFRQWSVEFDVLLNTSQLGFSAFKELVEEAPVGLGDGRRIGFGRFDATVERVK